MHERPVAVAYPEDELGAVGPEGLGDECLARRREAQSALYVLERQAVGGCRHGEARVAELPAEYLIRKVRRSPDESSACAAHRQRQATSGR